jgi:NAD(P)-dependent dehydrogenase (short-subunit alcohol dehydrogenase family)
MEIRFDNKMVLVTGASRGIGRAIATILASSGATVMVHYKSSAKEADNLLSALPGSDHRKMAADLASPDEIERLVAFTVESFGRIDILVNNAGIFSETEMAGLDFNSFQKYWTETMDVNLRGPAYLSFLVAREMIRSGGGKIINISSRGAFRGEPEAWAYGASKAGLNALGQSMAKALAPHKIYVYTLAPGYVDTEMAAANLTGKKAIQTAAQSPMNRVARPHEIAQAVALLAADGNEYMTGCILDMNGASYLRS